MFWQLSCFVSRYTNETNDLTSLQLNIAVILWRWFFILDLISRLNSRFMHFWVFVLPEQQR